MGEFTLPPGGALLSDKQLRRISEQLSKEAQGKTKEEIEAEIKEVLRSGK